MTQSQPTAWILVVMFTSFLQFHIYSGAPGDLSSTNVSEMLDAEEDTIVARNYNSTNEFDHFNVTILSVIHETTEIYTTTSGNRKNITDYTAETINDSTTMMAGDYTTEVGDGYTTDVLDDYDTKVIHGYITNIPNGYTTEITEDYTSKTTHDFIATIAVDYNRKRAEDTTATTIDYTTETADYITKLENYDTVKLLDNFKTKLEDYNTTTIEGDYTTERPDEYSIEITDEYNTKITDYAPQIGVIAAKETNDNNIDEYTAIPIDENNTELDDYDTTIADNYTTNIMDNYTAFIIGDYNTDSTDFHTNMGNNTEEIIDCNTEELIDYTTEKDDDYKEKASDNHTIITDRYITELMTVSTTDSPASKDIANDDINQNLQDTTPIYTGSHFQPTTWKIRDEILEIYTEAPDFTRDQITEPNFQTESTSPENNNRKNNSDIFSLFGIPTPRSHTRCAISGSEPYIEAVKVGATFPESCWDILCSEKDPYSFFNVRNNVTTFWYMDNNRNCFEQLIAIDENKGVFSKVIDVSPRIKVIVLNHTCVQSRGFAYIQTYQKNFLSITPACQESLCNSDTTVLYFARLKTIFIGPEQEAKFSEHCHADLRAKSQGNNINSKERVHYLSEYPESSPCPMAVVFKIFSSGTRVVIPFRSRWCETPDLTTWFEILVSFYSLNQTDSGLQLSRCLLHKSKYWRYAFSRYIGFFEDLFGEDLKLHWLPQQCVIFLCNANVEVSVIITNKGRKIWFPFLSQGSPNSSKIKEEVAQCQMAVQGVKDNQGQINEFVISEQTLLRDDPGPIVIFIPSLRWSCPSDGQKNEFHRVRSEILFNLWTVSGTLPESCYLLVCRGSVMNFHQNIFRIKLTYDSDINSISLQSCNQHMRGRYSSAKLLEVSTIDVSKTGKVVVFLHTNFSENNVLDDFLSLIHTEEKTEIMKYCDDYLHLARYSYDGINYYACTSKQVNTFNLWYKIPITKTIYFVVFKYGEHYNKNKNFLQWLSTVDIQISNATRRYIENLPLFIPSVWRSSIFFSFLQRNINHDFHSFVNDLEIAKLDCKKSSKFTLCYRQGKQFPDALTKTSFVLFLHNCFVHILDKDKLILLLLSQFREMKLTADYLCQATNMVTMMELASQRISFVTRGHRHALDSLINSMKLSYPSFLWDEGIPRTQWYLFDSGACLKLKDISMFTQLLRSSECVYYTNNGSTIVFQSVDNLSYHAFTFPLKLTNQTFQNHSTKFKLNMKTQMSINVPLRPTLTSPSTILHINKLVESPTPPYMLDVSGKDMPDMISLLSTVRGMADLILRANVRGNGECLRDVQEGKFTYSENRGMILLGPIHSDLVESSCFLSLPQNVISKIQKNAAKNQTTINKFWPSCLYNMVVSTTQRDWIIDWSYLDNVCKGTEIAMLVVAMTITSVTIVGNVFVLLVILNTGLIKEATFLIRASLATADLLLGMMPASLAIYDMVSLMRGGLSLHDLSPDTIHISFRQLANSQPPGFQHLRFKRFGYPMVCSVVFNISSIVTLLSLTLMGAERLMVILGRPPRPHVVWRSVGVTWLVGVALSLLINWRPDSPFFVGYFDPITKLTTTMGAGAPSVSLVAFYFVVTITATTGIVTVCLLIITIKLFHRHNRKAQNKLSIHSTTRDEEAARLTWTLLYMVSLFGVSCVPLGLDVLINFSKRYPVAHFFAWWLFLAGSSWNWALYSFSGGKFRKHVKLLFSRGIEK